MKNTKKKVEETVEVNEDELLDNLTDEELEALAQELEAGEKEDEPVEEEAVTQADVDGTKGMESNYKTNRLSVAMKSLAGMSNDQIDHFLKSLEQIGHEADGVPGGASAHNQASVAMKGAAGSITDISKGISESLKTSLKEDLSAVFGDNKELSEEFKEKITTLFEAAVSYRVTAVEQLLTEQYAKSFEEEVGNLTEELITKVDDYVSYVAEEWVKENEVAISHELTNEIAESFITDLKELFIKHYIDIPSDKVDVAEALHAKCEELEESVNKLIEDNMMLSESVKNSERENLITEFTTGMTLSQTEKFKQLIEDIDYDGDDEDFAKKMEIVRNSHFKDAKNSKTPSTNIITEEITYAPGDAVEPEQEEKLPADPQMAYYVKSLTRTVRH